MKIQLMIKIGIAVLAVFPATSFIKTANAQGNMVVNGGFDTDASGWILTNGAYWDSKFGNPAPSIGLLGHTAAVAQTINNLVLGTTYVVSGDYQVINTTINPSFGVAINDIYLFEITPQTTRSWINFSFFYTATSSSVNLSLSQINNSGLEYDIDNIAMYAVPEPSSFCLIGVGGVMGIFLFRQRPLSVRDATSPAMKNSG
jgi:PEP-CTERM motif